jgi:nitroimidazol reductase NimA-like FMN-containing flavoprotein (pyridoxamine 5'-phosphate oxidase superfamily)
MDIDLDGLEILSPEECWALLATAKLGRVGVSVGALPAIFPVNFAIDGETVLFRTGPGTKLRAAVDKAVVAFEVDQVDEQSRTGWSVLVVGQCSEVDGPRAVSDATHAGLDSWAGGERDHVVRLSSEFVSGRRIAATEGSG